MQESRKSQSTRPGPARVPRREVCRPPAFDSSFILRSSKLSKTVYESMFETHGIDALPRFTSMLAAVRSRVGALRLATWYSSFRNEFGLICLTFNFIHFDFE